MRQRILALVVLSIAAVSVPRAAAQSGPNDALAREIFKQLIEINTTDTPAGNVTTAAEAVAARLKAAGITDVQVLGPDPRKGNLVARLKGSGKKRPILLLAHLDVVEAKRADWTVDPFTFLEKDGFFYGRGTSDDKSMAAQFVANMHPAQARRRHARSRSDPGADRRRGGRLVQRRRLARQEPPRAHRRRVCDQRGRRRQHAEGQVPDQRGPGQREGLPGFPPRGEERRRPQLPAGERQRDLSPGGGPGAPAELRVPGGAERSHADLLRAIGRGRKRSQGGRRHARGGEGRARSGRRRAAVGGAAVLQRPDAHHLRGDAARGRARHQRAAATGRAPT